VEEQAAIGGANKLLAGRHARHTIIDHEYHNFPEFNW